ncbi:DUF2490 domain-containing protein [Ferruginibacter sp.]
MKRISKPFIIFLLCLSTWFYTTAGAQVKQTENVNQIWLGYLNQTRFSSKWGMWADVHLRTKENFVNNFSTGIIRAGITYYINDVTKFTLGYAYVNHFPAAAHKKISQPEHRPWQQLQWHTKYGKKRMMQWFRLEERYRRKILNDSTLAGGRSFNWKLRYNFWYEIPLSQKGIVPKAWSFIVNDELHINFGKQIVNNYFDQNRFFIGPKYQLSEKNNIQFGYSNIFIQTAAGNKYRNINAARIFFFQNIDATKKIK